MKLKCTNLFLLSGFLSLFLVGQAMAWPPGSVPPNAFNYGNAHETQLATLKDFGSQILQLAEKYQIFVSPAGRMKLAHAIFRKSKATKKYIELKPWEETIVVKMPTDDEGNLNYDSEEEMVRDVVAEVESDSVMILAEDSAADR